MEIKITNEPKSVLKKLYKKNRKTYLRLIATIEEIESNPQHKKFQTVVIYPTYKRAKVGKYRICFRVEDNFLIIARIDKRNKVYN